MSSVGWGTFFLIFCLSSSSIPTRDLAPGRRYLCGCVRAPCAYLSEIECEEESEEQDDERGREREKERENEGMGAGKEGGDQTFNVHPIYPPCLCVLVLTLGE